MRSVDEEHHVELVLAFSRSRGKSVKLLKQAMVNMMGDHTRQVMSSRISPDRC